MVTLFNITMCNNIKLSTLIYPLSDDNFILIPKGISPVRQSKLYNTYKDICNLVQIFKEALAKFD